MLGEPFICSDVFTNLASGISSTRLDEKNKRVRSVRKRKKVNGAPVGSEWKKCFSVRHLQTPDSLLLAALHLNLHAILTLSVLLLQVSGRKPFSNIWLSYFVPLTEILLASLRRGDIRSWKRQVLLGVTSVLAFQFFISLRFVGKKILWWSWRRSQKKKRKMAVPVDDARSTLRSLLFATGTINGSWSRKQQWNQSPLSLFVDLTREPLISTLFRS